MKAPFYLVAGGFLLLAAIACVVVRLYDAAMALQQIGRTFDRALADPYDLPYQPRTCKKSWHEPGQNAAIGDAIERIHNPISRN